MLQPAFDAAYNGISLPARDTPLKMLPTHIPPQIDRRIRHKSKQSAMTPRFLDNDVYLQCDTYNKNLGRILEMYDNGASRIVVTVLGKFEIDSKNCVLRCEMDKQSIDGASVSFKAFEHV